jgi:surface protein
MKTFLPLVLGALSFFSTTPAVVGVDDSFDCFPNRATLLAAILGISNSGVGYTYVDPDGNDYGLIRDWCFASTLTDFSNLFESKTNFNAPIGGWDVSSVTDMFAMFAEATAFNQPLNEWNVSSVIDMANMFHGASAFNQNLCAWGAKMNELPQPHVGGMFASSGCDSPDNPQFTLSPSMNLCT